MRLTRFVPSVTVLALIALGAPAPVAAEDDPPPHSWARVEPGTAFTLLAKTRAGPKHDEQKHESAVRYTLLSRNAETAKIRLELLVAGSPASTQEQEVPLLGEAFKGDVIADETVTVGAGIFDCKHLKLVAEGVVTDVWMHVDIPVPVKSVTRLPDGGTQLELMKIERVKVEEPEKKTEK